jgi:MFS family permease
VFAIYVLFLQATLLVFGSLSDHIGRRPLIMAAIAADAAAFVLFLAADGPGLLFAARALQGVAVGATANTLGAVLLDLRPRGGLAPLLSSNAPAVGLAFGGLLTSVLVQYGPAPAQLVWWLLLAAFAAAFVLVAVMPETGTRRPGVLASMRPHLSLPRQARGAFARALSAIVAVWALAGFYLSLGPSLAAQLTGSRNMLAASSAAVSRMRSARFARSGWSAQRSNAARKMAVPTGARSAAVAASAPRCSSAAASALVTAANLVSPRS